jgi:hypothetical protein
MLTTQTLAKVQVGSFSSCIAAQ